MRRVVSARLDLDVESPIDLVLSIAAAAAPGIETTETLILELDGRPVDFHEVIDDHGTRLHRALVEPGLLQVTYDAVVLGQAEPESAEEHDLISFLRPSRYCESDAWPPRPRPVRWSARHRGSRCGQLLGGQPPRLRVRVEPADGRRRCAPCWPVRASAATTPTCASRCCARCDVPARRVAVYAPGLDPMDFHAVARRTSTGAWLVIDPTTMAPRQSLVRIATGRDAADTAFLSTLSRCRHPHRDSR